MQGRRVKKQNEEEILDFGKPNFTFIPKEYHEWRQQGYYIICKSCELQHAIFIGMDKMLTGIDKKGKPILKNRKEIEGR